MQTIFAKRACTADGWVHDLRLTHDAGRITALQTGALAQSQDMMVDTLLPALANLHSHSFQRAMAGMTEVRAAGRDSFWTWRTLMYRFVEHINPEQYQAIAALVFMEMQEAGYASVGEFHYVHHQTGGTRYDSISELSQRVFAAARETGIGLTQLPVLYTYGGAGKVALVGGQIRFGNTVEEFGTLLDHVRQIASATLPTDTKVGVALHSLRATCPKDLSNVLEMQDSAPVHIHIAEQTKEVADVQNWLGARPVEWLLDNAPVDDTWCLIHATHMTSVETENLAKSEAVTGLCPITEANLGDGIFNGVEYLAQRGSFGIGSDSNVRISLSEELRLLEFSQRLRDQSRNLMTNGEGSVGEALYLGAAKGGAQALGRNAGRIQVGALADLLAVDGTTPALCALRDEQIMDGLCFAAGEDIVTDLWSAGRHQVRSGRHIAHDQIVSNYRTALQSLLASL